tara:strand:- start:158 stop:391 length:234 start_codon:yes stop_codon:yes gene_type:complete
MIPEYQNNNSYNNADSFAIAFDEAWKACDIDNKTKKISLEEKIEMAFNKMNSHPFLIDNPIESKNIALFRIKLLGLC